MLSMKRVIRKINIMLLPPLLLGGLIALGLLCGVVSLVTTNTLGTPATQRMKAFVIGLICTSCYARLFRWARARDSTLYWACPSIAPIRALGLSI